MSRKIRIKQCPFCHYYRLKNGRHTCSEPCAHGFKETALTCVCRRKCSVFYRKEVTK